METKVQQIVEFSAAKQLFKSIFQGEHTNKVQLFFLADVLNTYREKEGFKIIRTNTSGRLSKVGGWSLDFGVSGEGDALIHTAVESFIQRVPAGEHDHWLSSLVSLPISSNYIKGLVRPGCFDDGPIRKW